LVKVVCGPHLVVVFGWVYLIEKLNELMRWKKNILKKERLV